ncbi:major facilitator superfamily domain-containing protein 10-like [Rhopilema esculentum]|uniref:major facilitator superfamily domain-containing protein 10-like n=1 Tax=Rhopilema esculentum TaxID=499914 RepID=UPI0031D5173F|eukprot:gene3474-1856_t
MFRLFVILVIDLIAFTVILPLLPSILLHYEKFSGENEDSLLRSTLMLMNSTKEKLNMPNTDRYNSVLIGGFLGSLFSFLQFICNPVFGALSDIMGRKRILIVTMLGTALSYFVWLKSNTFKLFLLSRIIGGLSKGTVTVATAMMSDITTKENRGKGMAVIGIAFGVGFTVGPLCGAYFASDLSASLKNPFQSAAKFSLTLQIIAVILTMLTVRESPKPAKGIATRERISAAFALINPVSLLNSCLYWKEDPDRVAIKQLTVVHFGYLLLFSGLEFTLTFLTHQRFGFGNRQQGMLFLYLGVLMMLIQGGYVRRAKVNQERSLAIFGISSMIPSMVLVAFSNSTLILCTGLTFYAFGAATVVPCLTALYSQRASSIESGEMLGIFRSAGALARAMGPFLMCFVYWTFGSTLCYLSGALLFVLPLGLCSIMRIEDVKKD